MSLSSPFIRRPVATTLLTAAIVLAGAVAFRKLPVSPLPQVDFPTISVGASLPGYYAVSAPSLERIAEVTHVNLNDGVVEGIRALSAPAFGVQYHPEAGPGPHDARYLFESFRRLMSDHSGKVVAG